MNENKMTLNLKDVNANKIGNVASIFSLANGHFGVRANNPITGETNSGTLVNGFFEYSPINYGESAAYYPKKNQTIVDLPNLRKIKILNDKQQEFKNSELKDISLDLKSGKLKEVYEVATDFDDKIELNVISVIDQKNLGFYGIKFTFKAITYNGKITVDKRFDLSSEVKNDENDEIDDPRKTRSLSSIKHGEFYNCFER